MAGYEWVPCCDGFPERYGEYVVTVENENGNRFITTEFFSEVYGWCCDPEGWKIHAWMPMPDLYEHEGYAEFHVKTIEEMIEESE